MTSLCTLTLALLAAVHGCTNESGGSAQEGALLACQSFCEDVADCLAFSDPEFVNCLNSCDEEIGPSDDQHWDEEDLCFDAIEDLFDCAAKADCSDLQSLAEEFSPIPNSDDLLTLDGCEEEGDAVRDLCE